MGKAKKNIIFAMAFILPVLAALFLIYKMNRVALSDIILSNVGTVTGSVIHQALFVFALEVFGLCVMLLFNRYFKRLTIVMLSFIAGVLIWCLASVVVVCVGIAFKWYVVAILCLLVLAAAYFALKPQRFTKEDKVFYIRTLVLYASFSLFFASLCVFRFSYDSYMYINTGQKIAKLGYLPQELISVVSGFSLFTPMLFAPSEFFGYDFSQGLYIMLNAQFTIFVGYAVYDYLKDKAALKISIGAGVFAVLALVSSNIYFELMYWPLSNILTTMMMFGVVYFAWRAQSENENANMLVSAFFGICFVLTRSENMLLYICFMFIISLSDIKRKNLALHLTGAAVALSLWYFRFFYVAGLSYSEGAFLTMERAAGVIAVFTLFILYIIFLSKTDFILKRRKLIERLFYIAMVLAVIALAVLKPDFFIENSKSTLYNIFYDGAWAGAIMVFAAMYFIKLVSEPGFNYFDRQALVFILFYVIIFMLRAMSLRIGYGDSGNRYFAHILPILIFNISTTLCLKLK